MNDKKHIIFISHEASRTGAPLILLNFLNWLKSNSSIPFQVILLEDGDLRPDFEKIAPTYVYFDWESKKCLPERIFDYLARKIGKNILSKNEKEILCSLKDIDIGLIYSNTICNAEAMNFLSRFECPVITHVHELEMAIKSIDEKNFDLLKSLTDHYIACSECVADNLVDNHDIDEDKISTIHSFIPVNEYSDEDIHSRSLNVRKNLDIPEDALIVGCMGTLDLRKGSDLFIQLAGIVLKKEPALPIYFVWVGEGDLCSIYFKSLLYYDLDKMGLGERVRLIPHQSNPIDYISMFDLFVSVSREDPFPLVCLEASSLKKVIVGFSKTGGIQELVRGGGVFVVPYLDLEAMSDQIITLLKSPELRKTAGAAGRLNVGQYDLFVESPKIYEVIKKFYEQK